jgi:uncharacterized protein (DUF58 family)
VNATGAPRATVGWTGRSFLLLSVGAVLAAASVLERSAVPLFVALPLLLAPFVVASFGPSRPLTADLAWNAAGSGADVEVTGELRGSFAGAVADLLVEPSPPAGAVVVRPMRTARGRDALRFSLGWKLPEPTITTVPPPCVLWQDSLGLTAREVGGSRPPLHLSRYPTELRRLDSLRLDRTIALPGETRSRRVGPSGEFYGIREAAPDETWGRVNWRASARVGRLLANDYQIDLTGDLLLVLDLRPTSGDRVLDSRLLGISRAGVYGIADALFRSKVRIGFAAFGEFAEALPLSTGRGHRARVLRAIETSQLSEVAGPAERCAFTLRRYYRPGLTTLVVSSWTGEPAGELVPYLQRQGFPPLLISPSPLPMLEGTGRLSPEEEALARRLELVERRVRLSETWRYAPVVDWADYWTLEGLARFLRRPTRRRVS